MFYKRRAIIDKDGYNEYISKYASTKVDDYIDSLDDEVSIECFTIGLSNSHPAFYDQLWLIDNGEFYIPVLIPNINTSSGMAMWSCGIYCDEDDEANKEMTLDDILDLVGNGWKKGLTKALSKYSVIIKEPDADEIWRTLLTTQVN